MPFSFVSLEIIGEALAISIPNLLWKSLTSLFDPDIRNLPAYNSVSPTAIVSF